MGYSLWGCKESDMTEQVHVCTPTPTLTHTHTNGDVDATDTRFVGSTQQPDGFFPVSLQPSSSQKFLPWLSNV